MGGIERETLSVEGMVSSLRDFIYYVKRHIEHFKRHLERDIKTTNDTTISNEFVTKHLRMLTEEKEQIEGSILMKLGKSNKFFVFNNYTIESLPISELTSH